MRNDYKLHINACDLPNIHLTDAQAKTRIKNLKRTELQKLIDAEKSKINVNDFTFIEFDWKSATVRALYNPHPI